MPSSIPTLVPSLRSAALAGAETQGVGSFWRRSWNRTRANPAQIIPQCASAEAGSEESERCEGSSSVTMDLCQKTSTEEIRFCRAPGVSSNVSLVGWVSSWSASQPCSLGHASCLVVVSLVCWHTGCGWWYFQTFQAKRPWVSTFCVRSHTL